MYFVMRNLFACVRCNSQSWLMKCLFLRYFKWYMGFVF